MFDKSSFYCLLSLENKKILKNLYKIRITYFFNVIKEITCFIHPAKEVEKDVVQKSL